MLASLFDPHRRKVRVLRLQMVGSQLPHSQPRTSSALDGILAPTVVQILSIVGTSMLAFIVPNNTKGHALAPRGTTTISTRSNGDTAHTPDDWTLIDPPPLADCPLNFNKVYGPSSDSFIPLDLMSVGKKLPLQVSPLLS